MVVTEQASNSARLGTFRSSILVIYQIGKIKNVVYLTDCFLPELIPDSNSLA